MLANWTLKSKCYWKLISNMGVILENMLLGGLHRAHVKGDKALSQWQFWFCILM